MEPPDWLTDPDALIVAVGSGMYPEKQSILMRVSTNAAPDLASALRAEGIDIGPVPMNSALPWDQFAQIVVMTGGSLAGLAAVLQAFFHRHQHRSVKFVHKGELVELAGMSQKETSEMIMLILQETQASQDQNDALWDELMPSDDQSGDSAQ